MISQSFVELRHCVAGSALWLLRLRSTSIFGYAQTEGFTMNLRTNVMCSAFLVGCIALSAGRADASTIYFNDFEANALGFAGAGAREGTQGYGTLGYGQMFLRNDTGGNPQTPSVLVLNLASAASNSMLALDLAIIDSWDGFNCCGPDVFNVKLDGTVIFSQIFDSFGVPTVHPALVTKAYGVPLGFNSSWLDGAYLLSLSLGNLAAGPHTIDFYASGAGWQAGIDESWGIDNVSVTGDLAGTQVPEPVTGSLVLTGLGILGLARRRKSH
jgi:hypothetical protein